MIPYERASFFGAAIKVISDYIIKQLDSNLLIKKLALRGYSHPFMRIKFQAVSFGMDFDYIITFIVWVLLDVLEEDIGQLLLF